MDYKRKVERKIEFDSPDVSATIHDLLYLARCSGPRPPPPADPRVLGLETAREKNKLRRHVLTHGCIAVVLWY